MLVKDAKRRFRLSVLLDYYHVEVFTAKGQKRSGVSRERAHQRDWIHTVFPRRGFPYNRLLLTSFSVPPIDPSRGIYGGPGFHTTFVSDVFDVTIIPNVVKRFFEKNNYKSSVVFDTNQVLITSLDLNSSVSSVVCCVSRWATTHAVPTWVGVG